MRKLTLIELQTKGCLTAPKKEKPLLNIFFTRKQTTIFYKTRKTYSDLSKIQSGLSLYKGVQHIKICVIFRTIVKVLVITNFNTHVMTNLTHIKGKTQATCDDKWTLM